MLFWLIIFAVSLGLVGLILKPMITRENSSADGARPPFGIFNIIAASPILAAIIYLQTGRPEMLSTDFQTTAPAQKAVAPDETELADREAMINNMVSQLAARLEAEPDDVDGWRMLGRSYSVQGKYQESVAAYQEVMDRAETPSIDDKNNYATALVSAKFQNGEGLDQSVIAVLEDILENAPDNPLALFYLGAAARDNGNDLIAFDYWTRLRGVVPENAPIISQLDELIESVRAPAQ